MKCKPYSEITVEIWTQLKTVKITSNIFAVYSTKNSTSGICTSGDRTSVGPPVYIMNLFSER